MRNGLPETADASQRWTSPLKASREHELNAIALSSNIKEILKERQRYRTGSRGEKIGKKLSAPAERSKTPSQGRHNGVRKQSTQMAL